MLGTFSYRIGIAPATLALFSGGLSDGDADILFAAEVAALALGNFNSRGDKHGGKFIFTFL